ncbi:MAG: sn-glycerol-1-phosphate dehydrogenase [Ruminococcaceae bacterium]|nr:sn-glycerol-1-phosphate dehydrogenase [Oscillospiraceae bacterium]
MMKMECTCSQKVHTAPVECIEVSAGATEKVTELIKGYNRIFMVADENTYEVAGKRVEELLKEAGIFSHKFILSNPAHPTDKNVGRILIEAGIDREVYDINAMSDLPDYILAVGSGSVNDICRMVSYRLGLPYGIVGTAPSMDGYASVVAPLLVGKTKTVYQCSIARHIIIDTAICKDAPYELLTAGVGDMIGKYIAILDWELSAMHTGEYYCQKIADSVLQATKECIDEAYTLSERKAESIEKIVNGLITSGMGIAYSGSSRPASGTEHMIGQTWEIMDLESGRELQLHGHDVGAATFVAISMYKKLYNETDDMEIKKLIEKYLPAFDRILDLQKTLKLPITAPEKDKFVEGCLRGRTFRVRYTLLEYLYKKGMLEEYIEAAYNEVVLGK